MFLFFVFIFFVTFNTFYLHRISLYQAFTCLFIVFLGFPGGSEVKASACSAGDLGLIPGSGRSPGERNGNPLQYSWLGGLQSMGSQRVGHDWATSLSLYCLPSFQEHACSMRTITGSLLFKTIYPKDQQIAPDILDMLNKSLLNISWTMQ